jgi:hypothetical protein
MTECDMIGCLGCLPPELICCNCKGYVLCPMRFTACPCVAPSPLQPAARVLAAETTKHYRSAALLYSHPDDVVLEVGCHEGEARQLSKFRTMTLSKRVVTCGARHHLKMRAALLQGESRSSSGST